MSTWLVITGGDESHQRDASRPLPPIREDPLQPWLESQPEYRREFDFWEGELLTAEIHRRTHEAMLLSVGFSVTGREGAGFDDEWNALVRRLADLAERMGARLWDDGAQAFVG